MFRTSHCLHSIFGETIQAREKLKYATSDVANLSYLYFEHRRRFEDY